MADDDRDDTHRPGKRFARDARTYTDDSTERTAEGSDRREPEEPESEPAKDEDLERH